MSIRKEHGLGGWTLRDEAKFINHIGSHGLLKTQPNALGMVETLLYRYRKAVDTQRHPQTFSFSKAEVLMLINKRLDDIAKQRG